MRFILENPTGGKLRNDGWGSGWYGAPRAGRRHGGLDLTLPDGPGQGIISPTRGHVSRFHDAYGDKVYHGVSIVNDDFELRVRILYMLPWVQIGDYVDAGQVLGEAQDISERYPPHERYGVMIPHVHVDLWLSKIRCDPAPYIRPAP